MWHRLKSVTLFGVGAGLIAVLGQASEPPTADEDAVCGNAYHLFTGAYQVSDAGVVKLPDSLTWSVETSWRGPGLPDNRMMLRLHDETLQFSALTAQMDLATAARLHHELGDIIVKKLQDPDFQDRSHVGGATGLPLGGLEPPPRP